ncbi:trypsin-like serine peptidase [Staphylococcus sp. LKG3-1]|uniref:trypsin-like serine peptidase n=1 Tax=unclassified Staphylococcus TaxID=91994 RepID=UPI003B002198
MLKRKLRGGLIFIIALLCTVISINGNTYAVTQTHQSTDQSAQSEDAKVGTNQIKTRVVLPNDDRTQIENTTNGHYQSVGYISIGDNIATGVVIDKNTVLTNKHVANLSEGNMTFSPAAQNENTMSYGTFSEKEIEVYPGNEDLALIHLNKNKDGQSVGDVVQPATLKDASAVTKDMSITVTGYPGDKSLATMWESKGQILNTNTTEFEYNASTFGGNSGSPVFNENNEVIGIHQGGIEGESNSAVAMTDDVLSFINKNKS